MPRMMRKPTHFARDVSGVSMVRRPPPMDDTTDEKSTQGMV